MKAASFTNILVHEQNETGVVESREANVNDLLMAEVNDFRDWECWAGIQNITIDNEGVVWRAICRQGGKLGDIFTGFDIAEDTVICQKLRCNCAADLQLSKAKPGFRKHLRVGHGNENGA